MSNDQNQRWENIRVMMARQNWSIKDAWENYKFETGRQIGYSWFANMLNERGIQQETHKIEEWLAEKCRKGGA